MADLTKGLLNLNLSPEQAMLLDRQAREQQIQQQTQATPDVFRGMLQQAMRTADTLQNVPRALAGEAPPMGANQRMAIEAQQARALQLEQQAKSLNITKSMAKESLKVSGLPDKAISVIINKIDKDPTGEFSKQVISKYGTPEAPTDGKKYLTAGNNVFDTEAGEFITPPSNKTESLELISKYVEADIERFTDKSVKAANDIMLDTSSPLSERLKSARGVLVFKDTKDIPEDAKKFVLKDLEKMDVDGTLAKVSIIEDQQKLIENGITSGKGANVLTFIASVGSSLGVLTPEQQQELANTRTFSANSGNLVAQVIKAFGAGTGLSDADREYAKQIAAGDITIDELSLTRILDLMQRRAIDEIKTYNSKVESLGEDYDILKKEVPRFVRRDLSSLKSSVVDGATYYYDADYDEYYDANGNVVE